MEFTFHLPQEEVYEPPPPPSRTESVIAEIDDLKHEIQVLEKKCAKMEDWVEERKTKNTMLSESRNTPVPYDRTRWPLTSHFFFH